MAKTKIGGITVEIGADTSDLSKKLKDVNAESKKTTSELKSIDAALKQAPNSLELWKQKQEALAKAVENSKKKLEALNSEQENLQKGLQNGTITEEAYKAYQREVEITKGQIEAAEKALDDFTNSNNKAGDSAKKTGQEVEESGKKAEESSQGFTVLKGAVAKLAADGFEVLMKSAKDAWEEIDEGYDNIIKKTGATGDELESLQKTAGQVFKTMPVEMADVSSAIGEINTRFDVTEDELQELTEYFLKYAEINNTQVAGSVRNVAGIMKAFQEDTKNTGKVLDSLTDVSQRTGKDLSSLESELLSNSATFKELDLDIRQSAELLGQFEENGVDTSTALAGLKKAQQNAAAEGKNLTKALTETIDNIKNAKDETEALQIANDLFGKKGAAAMTQAIREQRFSIDDLVAGYDGMRDVVTETFEATQDAPDKAKIALNNLKLELASLAEAVLPKIEKLVSKGVDDLPKIEKTVKSLLPLIKSVGIAYASWKIGSTVNDGIKALQKLAVEMKTTETAAKGLSTALDTGVLAIVALIAAGLIDLGKELKRAHDEFVPTAEVISRRVSESFEEMNKAIEDVGESIDETNESFKEAADAADFEADRARELWEELQDLADENGKVKDSDKKRAEFIMGELNEALGTEISMTGTQIENYRTLQDEIDKLIEKKRASAYINAYEENIGEMAKSRATVYDQYQTAYAREQAALSEFGQLSQERYGRQMTPEEFQNLMASTYSRTDVWNTIDQRMKELAETAQTAGANRQQLQEQYSEINDYFNRLDDAQRAYTEGNYKEVEKRLYAQKDADREALQSAKNWTTEVEQLYNEQITKLQAQVTLARETNAKMAKTEMEELQKTLIQTASAASILAGDKSGDVFSEEFKDLVQDMIDQGFDIGDLSRWGKSSGFKVGDIFGDNYDSTVQAQIDQGFDVTDLLQWGAESGELTAAEFVKYFKQMASAELDNFFETNAQKAQSYQYKGQINLHSINSEADYQYWKSQGYDFHASGGWEYGKGIVAEAGPELLEVMNGGIRITPLTPSAKNTPVGAGKGTVNNYYYNTVNAQIGSKYDVYKTAEDLATAERRINQGKGK